MDKQKNRLNHLNPENLLLRLSVPRKFALSSQKEDTFLMRKTRTALLPLILFLCSFFGFHFALELKPKATRSLKLSSPTVIREIAEKVKTTPSEDSDTMSIVDTFVGNRGKGSNSGGLLYRRGQVFYTAARVFMDYKIVQWRCNQMTDVDETVITDIWNEAHERNAKFLGSKFISLEGLWVKLGQYLSSRADVMPDAYLRVLAKCQVRYYEIYCNVINITTKNIL